MHDTTPMRERLARASWKASALNISGNRNLDAEFDAMSEFDREPYFRVVDAILSELEKPTPEMVETAAGYLWNCWEHRVSNDHMAAAFIAAIRAAKETK